MRQVLMYQDEEGAWVSGTFGSRAFVGQVRAQELRATTRDGQTIWEKIKLSLNRLLFILLARARLYSTIRQPAMENLLRSWSMISVENMILLMHMVS